MQAECQIVRTKIRFDNFSGLILVQIVRNGYQQIPQAGEDSDSFVRRLD